MGQVHAANLFELQQREGACEIVAVVEADAGRAQRFLDKTGLRAPMFATITELAAAGLCETAIIVTPTDKHQDHAETLISKGWRVFVEKPLTGTLEGDLSFAAQLDRQHPHALMLGFQRRFDAPLRYAKELMDGGTIGRVFKIYSALEDSGPPPDGYQSGGILSDMSVHNVDEILWLAGSMPKSAIAIGSRLYGHKVSSYEEDFDDALMTMWFEKDVMAQVQVTRNHVSGYRVETILFGEQGQIQIGHFDQRPVDITVTVYGRRGRSEPLAQRTFSMGEPVPNFPEFMDRFGPAYKAEMAAFVECVRAGKPFPVTHRDGLRAQQVISAAMREVITEASVGPL
jgi:predicted dehydrogenase